MSDKANDLWWWPPIPTAQERASEMAMRRARGGLRKIADLPMPCASHDHEPPRHMVLDPGVYENVCSECGKRVVFTVAGPML